MADSDDPQKDWSVYGKKYRKRAIITRQEGLGDGHNHKIIKFRECVICGMLYYPTSTNAGLCPIGCHFKAQRAMEESA